MNKKLKTIAVTSLMLVSASMAQAQGWTVSGTNTYTNPLNNRVGIGTNAPTEKFQVGGGMDRVIAGSAYGANTGYGIGYIGFNASRQNASTWATTTDGGNNGGSVIYGDVSGSLLFSCIKTTGGGNQSISDGAMFNNIKMAIKANGNVGIGLNNPAAKLHIVRNFITNDGGNGTMVKIESSSSAVEQRGVDASVIANPGAEGTTNWGVLGSAINNTGIGAVYSIGVGGFASVNNVNGTTMGGWFDASSSMATGVYATASGDQSNALYAAASGTNSWAGRFGGSVYASGIFQSSDAKLKRDIKPLVNALDKLKLLKPSTYTYKTAEFKDMNLPEDAQMGVIAQDIEKVFPELVREVKSKELKGRDGKIMRAEQDFKAVNYIGLIPVLIAALQEQQKSIEQQQAEIQTLKKLVVTDIDDKIGIETGIQLLQNVPNPFNEQTIIKYNLPEDIKDAYIAVYDLAGKQMIKFPLSAKGIGAVTINSNQLAAGMYIYSIIANNKLVDSKRMVLTEN
jgi:hypothetical protein